MYNFRITPYYTFDRFLISPNSGRKNLTEGMWYRAIIDMFDLIYPVEYREIDGLFNSWWLK
jgi:hypothetical protein